jgi:hypothetical protein
MEIDISSAVAGLVVVLLLTIAERRRGVTSRRGMLMVYSLPVVVLAGGFAFGVPAVFLVSMVLSQENQSWEALINGGALLAILSIPSLWLFCSARRTTVLLAANGILNIKHGGSRRRILWKDVSSVTHSAFFGCYEVRRRDAAPIRVSQMLVGQREFAEAVLAHVPSAAVECGTMLRRVLAR